jgi:hypothetical protein
MSMTKIAGSGSESGSESVLVKDMDPRIQIHAIMLWIRKTGVKYRRTSLFFLYFIFEGKSSANLREDDERRLGLHVIFPLLVL